MSGKSQTNLLKQVCKRAAAMREPYRQSSWSIKTNRVAKKSPSATKTAAYFRAKIIDARARKIQSSGQKVCMIDKCILHLKNVLTNDYYLTFHKRNRSMSNKFNSSHKATAHRAMAVYQVLNDECKTVKYKCSCFCICSVNMYIIVEMFCKY